MKRAFWKFVGGSSGCIGVSGTDFEAVAGLLALGLEIGSEACEEGRTSEGELATLGVPVAGSCIHFYSLSLPLLTYLVSALGFFR